MVREATAVRVFVWLVAGLWIAPLGGAQVLEVDEAEVAKVQCKAGLEALANMWGSGGKVAPADWGAAQGDFIEWPIHVRTPDAPSVAIRYACAIEPARERELDLSVDGGAPIRVKLPGTRSWEVFETVSVALPKLSAGSHRLKLVAPAPHSATALDCFVLYQGDVGRIPAPMRRTTIAASASDRFVIRATARAPMRMTSDAVFKEFDRIFEHYEKFIGWAPPTPVGINLIEDKLWPNPGATSFQNNYGVYFRASVMDREQGNWCHEMTHMFYVAHFPWWFDESSVRVLTTFAWVPALYPAPGERPERDPIFRQAVATGKDVLANPAKPFDSPDAIHAALCVKYGPEVFSRFFHACTAAGKKGEINFAPGRHLTRDEIVKYMSQAAGEDVTPLYRQWSGFGSH